MNRDKIHIEPFDYNHLVLNYLNELKASGAYRNFINIEKDQSTFPIFDYIDLNGEKKSAVNWCSNDYLAMSTHSEVIEATHKSISNQGVGSGGTRNISGSTIFHSSLEKNIAVWHQKESALLFNSAYQANLTSLNTIGKKIPDLVFISDEENHASIIEGIRGISNKKYIFKHNDVSDLREILTLLPKSIPKLIVFESVYSISGTVAPLPEIISLAKEFGALSYVDEVHAVGLYGATGAGKAEEYGFQNEIDFLNGTLSKGIGCFGGYITASALWIDFLRSFASGFIFTTSLPPAICIAAETSILLIKNNSQLRKRFLDNVKLLRLYLQNAKIQYTGDDTHITQIHIGDAIKCKQIADFLLNHTGIYLQPINYPTVPVGGECLRITITPKHSFEQIHSLIYHLRGVLQNEITLIGRSSMLSKVQLLKAKTKINEKLSWIQVAIKYTETRGDQLTDIPLHTQEGTDFFTDMVTNDLNDNKADIAVHSLKDLSNHHFFDTNKFAVIDRDEVRDLAIFNDNILSKLKEGLPIRIGTCSFRREHLVLEFLKQALPSFGNEIKIHAIPIRGNIDTRIKKLSDQAEYDGIVLAFAGINRMLSSPEYQKHFQNLLKDKKLMVLPLLDCTPAPCQGAIALESLNTNIKASYILDTIDDKKLHEECIQEKSIAGRYGSGCIQKFGVITIKKDPENWIYANGKNQYDDEIDEWFGVNTPSIDIHPESIIHSDELGFTAIKTNISHPPSINTSAVFISHISAANDPITSILDKKRVWAAGTKTWIKLAKKDVWVEGCADSFGFECIEELLKTPVLNLADDITILTNEDSAARWANTNQKYISTYSISYRSDLIDKYKLKSARMIFWSCYAHFDHVKELLSSGLQHACLPGKTAQLLRLQGLDPILFPTLQSFYQWQKKYTLKHSVA